MLGASGWQFAEVGVGFDGDFNTILENFKVFPLEFLDRLPFFIQNQDIQQNFVNPNF